MFATRDTIEAFVRRLEARFGRPGRLLLVGEASFVYDGAYPWAARVGFAADVAPAERPVFDAAVEAVAAELGVTPEDEHPAEFRRKYKGLRQMWSARSREAAPA